MSKRNTYTVAFALADLPVIKTKMLNWLRSFSIFAYFDNNQYLHAPNRFELLVGAGSIAQTSEMPTENGDWQMGHVTYDYKNDLFSKLESQSSTSVPFEPISFFCPETVIYIPHGSSQLIIETFQSDAATIWEAIITAQAAITNSVESQVSPWQYNLDKEEYIKSVKTIRDHIASGDCYELNFCREALAVASIDPLGIFHQLNQSNPAPFAALYKRADTWLLCSSPERFLYKQNQTLFSQPIKGTARRDTDPGTDERLKWALQQNIKERAENVMIVDLVRNDLARCAQIGSVQVPQLFGVYSFATVHQLISTVSCTLKADIPLAEIIGHTFPMGSMTGAPKYIVMQLIDQYEKSTRGLYSGALGYLTPDSDFDFNVVIRSLVYNSKNQTLSYHTGGAITYDSDAEQEWQEVQLKAKALEQVVAKNAHT